VDRVEVDFFSWSLNPLIGFRTSGNESNGPGHEGLLPAIRHLVAARPDAPITRLEACVGNQDEFGSRNMTKELSSRLDYSDDLSYNRFSFQLLPHHAFL
jgi:hypothetical protein